MPTKKSAREPRSSSDLVKTCNFQKGIPRPKRTLIQRDEEDTSVVKLRPEDLHGIKAYHCCLFPFHKGIIVQGQDYCQGEDCKYYKMAVLMTPQEARAYATSRERT